MRLNKIILIVGRRATGKTTFLKKMVKLSASKVIVVDSFDHPDYRDLQTIPIAQVSRWKAGNVRVWQTDPLETLETIFKNCFNCTVVMEDCKRYVEPSVQKSIRQGIIEHRNRNIDLIMMFHNLKDVPPYVCNMHNDIVLFKTNDNMNKEQDKFSNWADIAKAHSRIMKSANPYYNEVINLQ